jgi:hypothetical protein
LPLGDSARAARRSARQEALLRMSWFNKSRSVTRQRRGVLTLEWVLLITVVVIGIIGGLGTIRNATNGELIDLAEAIRSLNI